MKKLILNVVIILLILSLCACGQSQALPEGFDEGEVLAAAEKAIELVSAGDYETLFGMFSAEMSSALSPEDLEAALSPVIEKLGAFKSFKAEATAGGSNEQIGEFAIAAIICEYENGKATYTISIDEDGMVCGLYVK